MITLANLHKAMKRLANDPDEAVAQSASIVANITEFAAEHEAERKNAIKRQTNRRVIRLTDRA